MPACLLLFCFGCYLRLIVLPCYIGYRYVHVLDWCFVYAYCCCGLFDYDSCVAGFIVI